MRVNWVRLGASILGFFAVASIVQWVIERRVWDGSLDWKEPPLTFWEQQLSTHPLIIIATAVVVVAGTAFLVVRRSH